MSTTTQETAGSSPQMQAAQKTSEKGPSDKTDKKKLKLLKTALKDERAAKENIEKELQAAIQKIEHLNR